MNLFLLYNTYMIYLLLAILSSSLVSIIMRIGNSKTKNNIGLLVMNYFFCVIFAIVTSGTSSLKLDGITTFISLISGFLYLFAFVIFQYNVNKNGVVLSSTFMKLGVIVPTLLSCILFHESASVFQFIGIIIAIISIIIMNLEKDENKHNYSILLFLLVIAGTADFMAKIYTQFGSLKYQGSYIVYTFLTAFILCIFLMFYKKQRIEKEEILFGLLLGLPNFFSAKFLLNALNTIPAIITYPCINVGVIVFVCIIGMLIFKEKINKKQWIGILCIMISIALLNM